MIDQNDDAVRGRRAFLKNGLVLGATLAVPGAVSAAQRKLTQADLRPLAEPPVPASAGRVVAAQPVTSPRVVRPELLRRAMAALDTHGSRVANRDRIAIADMAAPSAQPRFHIVDLASGRSQSFLVAHGSGSDPSHTGYLKRFSNDPGSNASCEGAFLTSDYYVGKHGNSQRLIGLDATNDNALARAIVVHSAWYANADMIRSHGMLGRSQGCFAVGEGELAKVFAALGPGRMIYSAKI
ncbi:transcriptional initiation protein Tat [Sphingomonas sp. MA1305]|uniref:murein L,D-transpeptidase catalytic domain family protein n=1 Tax=unclassified Sphingomonas TaxID=196159 RepID=UPI0018E04ED2|nr:murein L,D-transpeptidase catalytic domain family protein [Sphingomonas sp. MA1305]MBI0475462.1 transcriptional initiation protein Tat [Sphingomonas sp. MA1305]